MMAWKRKEMMVEERESRKRRRDRRKMRENG
jgi:hypothetical protein